MSDWTIIGPDGTKYDFVKKWEDGSVRGFVDIRVTEARKQTGWICRQCGTNKKYPCLIMVHHVAINGSDGLVCPVPTEETSIAVRHPVWEPFYGEFDSHE